MQHKLALWPKEDFLSPAFVLLRKTFNELLEAQACTVRLVHNARMLANLRKSSGLPLPPLEKYKYMLRSRSSGRRKIAAEGTEWNSVALQARWYSALVACSKGGLLSQVRPLHGRDSVHDRCSRRALSTEVPAFLGMCTKINPVRASGRSRRHDGWLWRGGVLDAVSSPPSFYARPPPSKLPMIQRAPCAAAS